MLLTALETLRILGQPTCLLTDNSSRQTTKLQNLTSKWTGKNTTSVKCVGSNFLPRELEMAVG